MWPLTAPLQNIFLIVFKPLWMLCLCPGGTSIFFWVEFSCSLNQTQLHLTFSQTFQKPRVWPPNKQHWQKKNCQVSLRQKQEETMSRTRPIWGDPLADRCRCQNLFNSDLQNGEIIGNCAAPEPEESGDRNSDHRVSVPHSLGLS